MPNAGVSPATKIDENSRPWTPERLFQLPTVNRRQSAAYGTLNPVTKPWAPVREKRKTDPGSPDNFNWAVPFPLASVDSLPSLKELDPPEPCSVTSYIAMAAAPVTVIVADPFSTATRPLVSGSCGVA